MNRAITLAVLLNLAVPVAVSAATSNASNRFTVPGSSDSVAAWYEAHRAGVLNSSNCRILEDRGHGEYKVQTDTPVGACQYIIRERREQTTTKTGRKQTTYRISLVRVLSGRLDNQTVTISLTDLNGGTEVDMRMTTSVAGRLVPVRAVTRVQDGCLAGCERYMTSNVR
jgi:hypothetical protein